VDAWFISGQDTIQGLAFAPDGQTLVSSSIDSPSIAVWNVRQRVALGSTLNGHSEAVLNVAFSPTESTTLASVSGTVAGATFGALWLWDTETGEHNPLLSEYDTLIPDIEFSPDGQTLAAGSLSGDILLWDVESGEQMTTFATGNSIASLAFSPDETLLATGGRNGFIYLWTFDGSSLVANGEPLQGHSADISALAFSPDGSLLLSGSHDDTLRLWDMNTRELLVELTAHTNDVTSAAFSPNGQYFASASLDDTVIIWDAATREPLTAPLNAGGGDVFSVAFSPDSSIVAAGTNERFVILWDVATGRRLGSEFTGHRGQVNSVAFNSDGTLLASGDGNPTNPAIIVWDVDMASWEARACQIANRTLTTIEWQLYLPTQPYESTCQ
jgi:WD40 repeat protein